MWSSANCAHHDVDVTAFGYVWGQVPQLPAVFASDENLICQAEKAAQVFEGAAVTQGLIVSGDRFVHSSEGVTEIRSHFPDVKAVEMEAAAIAQTCYQLEVPFVIIRAVSDSADEKADISFEEFFENGGRQLGEDGYRDCQIAIKSCRNVEFPLEYGTIQPYSKAV